MLRLDDQHAAVHPHDAARLAQHDLDLPRVLPPASRVLPRHLRRLDRPQLHQPALRLRDDLLRDDQHVAVEQRRPLRSRGVDDERGDIVAGRYFGHARHADDAHLRQPRRGFGRHRQIPVILMLVWAR